MNKKEFLYVGHYFDTDDNFILKIGTTNDLKRRAAQHTCNYRKSPKYKLPKTSIFVYDWWIPLSKYNTQRYEDKNRIAWQELGIGEFVRNDRFNCGKVIPEAVEIKIKKTYVVPLMAGLCLFIHRMNKNNKKCIKKSVDISLRLWYNWPAADACCGRNFYIIPRFNIFVKKIFVNFL